MDESLLAAFQATDYRVRLAGGGVAGIRIGQPLPTPLRELVGPHLWGFITAWNPRSLPRSRQQNRHAQRQLREVLRPLPSVHLIRAAVGVGSDGWREHSLFVIGPDLGMLDELAHRFGQHAYVYGGGGDPAQLRLLSPTGER